MLLSVIGWIGGCGAAPEPVAPPPILPTPDAWVGSAPCAACHPEASASWSGSWHARGLRAPSSEDLDQLSELLACADLESSLALGGRHELRFLQERTGSVWGGGRWLALPCGWDKRTSAPSSHHADDWRSRPWERDCAGCHVTGFRGPDAAWSEPGVGCEACHGPGAAHAGSSDPARIVRFPQVDELAVCGACHLQGARSRRTGQHVPDRFVPGAPLYDDWVFDWASLDLAASPIDLHQKVLVREHLEGRTALKCTSCHAMHGLGHDKHQAAPREPFCDACHEADLSLKEYEQSCAVCEF